MSVYAYSPWDETSTGDRLVPVAYMFEPPAETARLKTAETAQVKPPAATAQRLKTAETAQQHVYMPVYIVGIAAQAKIFAFFFVCPVA